MTGTPLTVSPIEVQTIGYPWTYHQLLVLCLGVDTTQRGEKRKRGRGGEEGRKGRRKRGEGTYEIGSTVNWAIISLTARFQYDKLTRLYVSHTNKEEGVDVPIQVGSSVIFSPAYVSSPILDDISSSPNTSISPPHRGDQERDEYLEENAMAVKKVVLRGTYNL
jgi:hypothetical protein